MSRYVRDRDEFEHGSKWFSDLHRSWGDDETMIDIDGYGYCRRCNGPLYLVEATRSRRRKAAYVTERLATIIGVPCLVVYADQDRPGLFLVDNRTARQNHGWVAEDALHAICRALRSDHVCNRFKGTGLTDD